MPIPRILSRERTMLMKTKLIALLLALAMCCSLLTACGSGGTDSADAPEAQSPVSSEAAADAPEVSADTADAAASASMEEATLLSAPAQEAVTAPEPDPSAPEAKVGMLSILNLSEEDAAQMLRARKLATTQLVKEGTYEGENPDKNGPITVVYYDSLESMLMALKAGQLTSINVTESVADYLLLKNPDLAKPLSHNDNTEHSTFAEMMESGLVGEGYAFMMMEDHAALRDEFDKALDDMKEDGTLDRLIQEQITDVMQGKEPTEIEVPPLSDAETITVAVTGALPPMDYVSSIGMPVGFSTAVLAEISQRIHKNISISVIDSGARASALASGRADVVFWTRTSTAASEVKAMSEEERYALSEGLTDEEVTVIQQINSIYDFTTIADMDIPQGTIVTQPYYTGYNLPVLVQQ